MSKGGSFLCWLAGWLAGWLVGLLLSFERWFRVPGVVSAWIQWRVRGSGDFDQFGGFNRSNCDSCEIEVVCSCPKRDCRIDLLEQGIEGNPRRKERIVVRLYGAGTLTDHQIKYRWQGRIS